MPVDFDEEDINDVIEETEEQYEAQQSFPSDDDVDEQMSEVEKRLEMAQYYRLLLNDSIFDNPPNPEVAERVENEIRDFIRGRMSLLVGVGSEPKKTLQIISDGEATLLRELANPEIIRVVKELAAKLLKKPALMEFKPKPVVEEPKLQPKVVKEPTLRKTRPGGVKKVSAPVAVEAPIERTPQPSRFQKPVRGQRQKRIVRTVTKEDGTTFKQDITPPAQPVGVQPLPTPRSIDQIETTMAQVSGQHANMAVRSLDKKLTGKG